MKETEKKKKKYKKLFQESRINIYARCRAQILV